jgi:hypothetical protein
MSLTGNFLQLSPSARCKAQTHHTALLRMRFATLANGSCNGNSPMRRSVEIIETASNGPIPAKLSPWKISVAVPASARNKVRCPTPHALTRRGGVRTL